MGITVVPCTTSEKDGEGGTTVSDGFKYRVPSDNCGCQIYLDETDAMDGPGLALTADVGDEETTVVLGAYGIRELRLALARFERAQKSPAPSAPQQCEQQCDHLAHDVTPTGTRLGKRPGQGRLGQERWEPCRVANLQDGGGSGGN